LRTTKNRDVNILQISRDNVIISIFKHDSWNS